MDTGALFSSERRDWETPAELFDRLDKVFSFDLDVCATEENAKVSNFISPETDAFLVDWKGSCWMNPPYGRPEEPCLFPHDRCRKKKCQRRGHHIRMRVPGVGDWVRRAIEQVDKHDSTVVCLLPARTDTDWFQGIFNRASLLAFLRGRWKFVGADAGATFPSCIAVFAPGWIDDSVFEELTEIGNVIDPSQGGILVYNR